jgi:hypothetical protein
MRRLVFMTQAVDPEHPESGGEVGEIRRWARDVDDLVVIAFEATPRAAGAPEQSAPSASQQDGTVGTDHASGETGSRSTLAAVRTRRAVGAVQKRPAEPLPGR